jgi:hypothetical protein
MINFKSHFIVESIIDPDRKVLSFKIFDFNTSKNPKLKESVISQIQIGLSELAKYTKIIDYSLIGSILTRRYTDQADLDVTVLIDADNQELKNLKHVLKQINGKLVFGTEHPINYFLVNNQKDYFRKLSLADAVFNIKKNAFERKSVFKKFNVKKYLSDFKSIVTAIDTHANKLISDLFDYEQLNLADKIELKYLRMKILNKLEDDAIELSDIYHKIKKDRQDAFDRELSPDDIKKYGDKNRLPENVIYKLLEKYHYLDFLKRIDSILGDDRELTSVEANELVSLLLLPES